MARGRLIALSALERAMKIQEIILKAMSGEIKWRRAAEIIGISGRQMRRWKRRYDEHGCDGLFDRRRKLPSPRKIPMETAQKILRLYREEYLDFNMRHFYQKTKEKHRLSVSYSWIGALLQGSGLVLKSKKRGQYRRTRERPPFARDAAACRWKKFASPVWPS
jgi:transposase